ncbi:MAG: hypothetical protein ACFFC7_10060 [Candidatus Hermodarchaeota archaeon]
MHLPEDLAKLLDTIKVLIKKSGRDRVKFSVVLASWNRAHKQARITLPVLLSRVKMLRNKGLIEIVESKASTPLLGQVNVQKSSIRLLDPAKED